MQVGNWSEKQQKRWYKTCLGKSNTKAKQSFQKLPKNSSSFPKAAGLNKRGKPVEKNATLSEHIKRSYTSIKFWKSQSLSTGEIWEFSRKPHSFFLRELRRRPEKFRNTRLSHLTFLNGLGKLNRTMMPYGERKLAQEDCWKIKIEDIV